MAGANRAYVEALLVGVPLPASRDELLRYARAQDGGAEAVAALRRLRSRGPFHALQDVGEQLEPVQPGAAPAAVRRPEPESGKPPGGDAYTRRPGA